MPPFRAYSSGNGVGHYQITTYLTDSEIEAMEAARVRVGLSRAAFIRMAIKILIEDTNNARYPDA